MKILPTWKMSQKSSTDPNPKPDQSETFFLFRNLPREIRNKIYVFALNDDKPRITQVTYSKYKLYHKVLERFEQLRHVYKMPRWSLSDLANSHSRQPIKEKHLSFHTRSIHPLLHTCRESRAEVYRLYPSNNSQHGGGGGLRLPFNTNLDILQFGSIYDECSWGVTPPGDPISEQELRKFVTSPNQEHIFQNVRNLMISTSVWRKLCKTPRLISRDMPKQVLLPFRSLQKLIIILPWNDRRNVRKYLKALKEDEEGRAIALVFSVMPASMYFTDVVKELKADDPEWSCPDVELWLPRRDGTCVPFAVPEQIEEGHGYISQWVMRKSFIERFLDRCVVERLGGEFGAVGI